MMNRLTALALAIAVTGVTISTTSFAAAGPERLHFDLSGRPGTGQVEARFSQTGTSGDHRMSTTLDEGVLTGLDHGSFRAGGSHALRFAMNRESARMDCAGTGGDYHAWGDCSFTPDPGFAQFLQSRVVGDVSRQDWFGLFALDVHRDTAEAIAAAGYPKPTVDQLIEFAAVGVTGHYIRELARNGYRPSTLNSLVEFKAVGVDPQWLGELARAGFANVPNDEIVQLKALGVDAAYIQGFRAIGYRPTTNELVQLKALGVTADFARRARAQCGDLSADKLVQLRAIGVFH